jgi:hypothetical protein
MASSRGAGAPAAAWRRKGSAGLLNRRITWAATAEEVRAILPLNILLIYWLQICLINQRRSAACSGFAARGRQAGAIPIDERYQLIQSSLITWLQLVSTELFPLGERA